VFEEADDNAFLNDPLEAKCSHTGHGTRKAMTLTYACIAPHAGEAIEELTNSTTVHKFQKTRDGLRNLAVEVGRAKPDTIVIATPHNVRLWKKIGIVTSENSTGILKASPQSKAYVTLKARCDVDFARKLLQRSTRRGLPVVGVNYGTSEGISSDLPMDWGTLIPLWFMMPRCRKKPKIVIVTPSREIPLLKNFEFGHVIADEAEAERSRRIVFVASADQAHAYKRSGPYGFNARAKEYDQLVLDALSRNRIGEVMNIKSDLVKAAKPDSLWQMAILAGISDKVKLKANLVSYEVPTYFGMISAHFR
jgi:aromatic ring-opening dioxygenase LigB subunit